MTGIGLRTSGLNLDLQIPPQTAPHEALIIAYRTLCMQTDEFSDVVPDFTAKIPVVSFFAAGCRCELSLNNNLAYQTSALLRDYVQLDSRAKILLVSYSDTFLYFPVASAKREIQSIYENSSATANLVSLTSHIMHIIIGTVIQKLIFL